MTSLVDQCKSAMPDISWEAEWAPWCDGDEVVTAVHPASDDLVAFRRKRTDGSWAYFIGGLGNPRSFVKPLDPVRPQLASSGPFDSLHAAVANLIGVISRDVEMAEERVRGQKELLDALKGGRRFKTPNEYAMSFDVVEV